MFAMKVGKICKYRHKKATNTRIHQAVVDGPSKATSGAFTMFWSVFTSIKSLAVRVAIVRPTACRPFVGHQQREVLSRLIEIALNQEAQRPLSSRSDSRLKGARKKKRESGAGKEQIIRYSERD